MLMIFGVGPLGGNEDLDKVMRVGPPMFALVAL
jgi:hypothetical protein